MSKNYVKVARCTIDPNDGREIIKNLNQGGEAQIWEKNIWDKYHKYISDNPQVRGTIHYPWTFVEYVEKPQVDLKEIVVLPEKTNGREFLINTNAK